jgi:DNA-binding NarL/FixJ family response regulator
MISSWNANQYVKRSLVAGARGYVLKDDVHEVIAGIQRVLEGGTYLSKLIAEDD